MTNKATLRATLSAEERLKSRAAIDFIFKEGKTKFAHPLKLYYYIEPNSIDKMVLKFGISVPKSLHRKAVRRNRLKRKVRESYRNSKTSFLQDYHHLGLNVSLFFIYIDKEGLEVKIESAIHSLLKMVAKELNREK